MLDLLAFAAAMLLLAVGAYLTLAGTVALVTLAPIDAPHGMVRRVALLVLVLGFGAYLAAALLLVGQLAVTR